LTLLRTPAAQAQAPIDHPVIPEFINHGWRGFALAFIQVALEGCRRAARFTPARSAANEGACDS